jgi:hypothetical protein
MSDGDRVVKIRVNASGRRIIGFVRLPPETYRISDVLNGPDPYLSLEDEEDPRSHAAVTAILKDCVSYVEAVEEPETPARLRRQGTFRLIVVELREPPAAVAGELFLPGSKSALEVLNDSRLFINLRNAQFLKSHERYTYVAIAKKQAVQVQLPDTSHEEPTAARTTGSESGQSARS